MHNVKLIILVSINFLGLFFNKSIYSLVYYIFLFVFVSDSYRYSLFSNYFYFTIKLLILFYRNETTKIATLMTQIYLIELTFTFKSIQNYLFENFVNLCKHEIVDCTTHNLKLFSFLILLNSKKNGVYSKIIYSM